MLAGKTRDQIEEFVYKSKIGRASVYEELPSTKNHHFYLDDDNNVLKAYSIPNSPVYNNSYVLYTGEEAFEYPRRRNEDGIPYMYMLSKICVNIYGAEYEDAEERKLRRKLHEINVKDNIHHKFITIIPEGTVEKFNILKHESNGFIYDGKSESIFTTFSSGLFLHRPDVHEYILGLKCSRSRHVLKTIDFMMDRDDSFIVMERADFNLDKLKYTSLNDFKSYVFQMAYAIYNLGAINHNYINSHSIMFTKSTTKNNTIYRLEDRDVQMRSTEYEVKLGNFSHACSWEEPKLLSTKMINSEINLSVGYNRYVDLFMLLQTIIKYLVDVAQREIIIDREFDINIYKILGREDRFEEDAKVGENPYPKLYFNEVDLDAFIFNILNSSMYNGNGNTALIGATTYILYTGVIHNKIVDKVSDIDDVIFKWAGFCK